MPFNRIVSAALFAAIFLLPVSAPAQTPPPQEQAEQKPEGQSGETEYKKPRRAPRQHIHYEGDGHDHSKDKHSHTHRAGTAHAHTHETRGGHDHFGPGPHAHGPFEAEAMFAFTAVSSIGDVGDRHVILSLDGAGGRRDGSFRKLSPAMEIGFNPHERLHVALELWSDYFRIRNVAGLDDQNRWGGGAALEFKVALLRRGSDGPVGVTLILAPHYSNSEEVTGEKAHHYAMEMKLAADVELVKDMLLLAWNLQYEPARVKARGEPEWEKESLFGASAALMARMTQNILLGVELQYFRAYEGYALNRFAGRALYAGPTLHVKISDKAQFVAGWQTQVSGRAAGDPRSLDLENFERHRAKLLYSQHF